MPQGISGAVTKRGGLAHFKELRKCGVLPLGGAAVTGPGRLPFKAIIHVAGIGHSWRSSEVSIRGSVRSAISKAEEHGFKSLGFPLIGAGTGGGSPDKVEGMIREEIERSGYTGRAVIVRYTKKRREQAAS